MFDVSLCPRASPACPVDTLSKVTAVKNAVTVAVGQVATSPSFATASALLDSVKLAAAPFLEKDSLGDVWYCAFGVDAAQPLRDAVAALEEETYRFEQAVFKKFPAEVTEMEQQLMADEILDKEDLSFVELSSNPHSPTVASARFMGLSRKRGRARARVKVFAKLWRLVSAVRNLYQGWMGAAVIHQNIGHCIRDRSIFPDCTGAHRTFAQTQANCGNPMLANHAANQAPAASNRNWNGALNNAEGGRGPAIIGFGGSIIRICYPRDCHRSGFHRLYIRNPVDWDHCVNLQWTYCSARGALPNQNGDKRFYLATAPNQINVVGRDWGVTNQEFCALSKFCNNANELFNTDQAPAVRVAENQGVDPHLAPVFTCVPNERMV